MINDQSMRDEEPCNIAVTYDSDKGTDGLGSQLYRIIGIYALSRHLGIPYVHTPLTRIGYQGMSAMANNAADPDLLDNVNRLFHIASDVPLLNFRYSIEIMDVDARMIELVKEQARSLGAPILTKIILPLSFCNAHPDCFEIWKARSPFASPSTNGGVVRIALHIRRGDVLYFDPSRLLPNHYYINVAGGIIRILEAIGVPYRIEIHTEVLEQETVLSPHHHGTLDRIKEDMVLKSDVDGLADFRVLPNRENHFNAKVIDCLESLATADILVMSRSALSFVAATLNRTGAIFYHPFSAAPMSAWVVTDGNGRFDSAAGWNAIISGVRACRETNELS